jgi:hypothetical protein
MSIYYRVAFALSICIAIIFSPTNAIGQKIALELGTSSLTTTGYTVGRYSLSDIAKFDRVKHACLGFAAATPDRTIDLTTSAPKLTFQANSRNQKALTLLVQTPDGQILCGDDNTNSKDAKISATDLPAGSYKIWVGSLEYSKRINYILTIDRR